MTLRRSSLVVLAVVSLAGLAGAAGCASPTAGGGGSDEDALTGNLNVTRPVQMNDLSVLLPLVGKSQSDVDTNYLNASAKAGADGARVLFPETIFDAANGPTSGPRSVPTWESMRLVAFRFDPCFAQIGAITSSTPCDNQLRLVFQAVQVFPGAKAPNADDGAFHVFYSISRAQFVRALDEMTALRLANDRSGADLGPLAIHPLVKKQGMTGAMAKGLNAIVLKYADPAKIVKTTSFHGVFAQGTTWSFDQVDVSGGVPVLANIPTLSPAGAVESMRLGTAADGLLSVTMNASTHVDGNRLFLSPVQLATASDAEKRAAYDSALRIENPAFHSPNTIDCSSCHTAQISRQLIGEQHFKIKPAGNPNLFAADASVPKADLALSVPVIKPVGLSLNLHAFSYDGQLPTIITRVVNETASNVAFVNTSLLQK